MIQIGMYPRKCRNCGKEFECRKEWGWKIPRNRNNGTYFYFCRYSCMREYEKAKEARKKPKMTPMTMQVLGLLREGYNQSEAGRIVGMTYKQVNRIKEAWGNELKEAKIG